MNVRPSGAEIPNILPHKTYSDIRAIKYEAQKFIPAKKYFFPLDRHHKRHLYVELSISQFYSERSPPTQHEVVCLLLEIYVYTPLSLTGEVILQLTTVPLSQELGNNSSVHDVLSNHYYSVYNHVSAFVFSSINV